jgi:hypothetical protein
MGWLQPFPFNFILRKAGRLEKVINRANCIAYVKFLASKGFLAALTQEMCRISCAMAQDFEKPL